MLVVSPTLTSDVVMRMVALSPTQIACAGLTTYVVPVIEALSLVVG